jgi:hypothetical protein
VWFRGTFLGENGFHDYKGFHTCRGRTVCDMDVKAVCADEMPHGKKEECLKGFLSRSIASVD